MSLKGEGTSSGGYLQIPNFTWSTLLSGGPGPTFFTISFWYKKPASSITETNARICDFYYNSTNYFYIYFNSDGNLVMKKNDTYGSQYSTFYTATTVCDGRWHHFAITYTQFILYNYYIDGVLQGSYGFANAGLGSSYTFTSCYIGRSSTSTDYYATECIDDFRIYNNSLNAGSISSLFSLYNRPSCNFYNGNPPVNLSLYM